MVCLVASAPKKKEMMTTIGAGRGEKERGDRKEVEGQTANIALEIERHWHLILGKVWHVTLFF